MNAPESLSEHETTGTNQAPEFDYAQDPHASFDPWASSGFGHG